MSNSGPRSREIEVTGRARRPVILMTADIGSFGGEPSYVLRTNYAEALAEAGGLAFVIPCEPAQLSEAFDLADGVLITGSGPGVEVAPSRIDFERELIRRSMDMGKPLMGICHGMQLIGEHLGGEITRDRPDLLAETTRHIPGPVPDRLAHRVAIEPGTQLRLWHGASVADVNSLHRHALVGQGRFRVAAWAPDGIIEAFEGVGNHFCLGVQWHPEYSLTALDRRILQEFIAQSRMDGRAGGDRFCQRRSDSRPGWRSKSRPLASWSGGYGKGPDRGPCHIALPMLIRV